MRAVLIQPHPDDLAYSIGGSMIKRMFGENPLAITVFSRGNSAKKDIQNITEVRKKEDKEFFKKLGVSYIDLNYTDSSIRPFHMVESTYEDVKLDLTKLISWGTDVFVPMSIGYHIDHLIVREACRGFKNITYYEDIPYVFRYNPRMEKYLKRMAINISDVMSTKIENLRIYKSQMDNETLFNVSGRKEEGFWFSEQIKQL